MRINTLLTLAQIRDSLPFHRHIYGKIDVNGDSQHPLYEFLKESCPQTVVQLGHSNEVKYVA